MMLGEALLERAGFYLEIGSGGGFLKSLCPRVITSEILPVPNVDIRTDALFLPFKTSSLAGIFCIDVLHHLPDVEQFFKEAIRTLRPKGRLIMIEPWRSAWSHWVYRYLHHEPYDCDAATWRLKSGGPLSEANGALPWIIFERDRPIFTRTYSSLRIKKIELHSPFIYLLSGGVSLRSLVPYHAYPFLKRMEIRLCPWMNYLAMFALIVLERN